jgi:MFS family permease
MSIWGKRFKPDGKRDSLAVDPNENSLQVLGPATLKATGTRAGTTLSHLRTFSSLKISAYRFYFLGMAGQWGAMNMQMVTRALLVYRLTGSAALLGWMSLAQGIPMLLLSFLGGVFADRMPKKHIIQAGQAVSGVVALSVAIALTTGYLSSQHPGSWWILMVNSALQGTIMGLMMPARQAIIPEIVGREHVMNAVALNSTGMNTLRLIAPAVAGILIDSIGFEAIFYAMAGLYVISVFFTAFIPATGARLAHSHNALFDIKQGLQYIWSKNTIRLILAFIIFFILLSMPYQYMMPVFADDILKVGATGMGVLMSVSGAGALIGSLAIASLPTKRRGAMLLTTGLIMGISLAVFSFSESYPLSLVMMLFVGLGQTGYQTVGTTLLQSYTDPEYLGRVMSINMMNVGLSSVGTFFAGILAEVSGAQWSIGGFSAVLALLSILALVFLPVIRKLD